jgi:hypothetical protein
MMRLSRLGTGTALPLGVLPQDPVVEGREFPHPPRSSERVDLPRKRER